VAADVSKTNSSKLIMVPFIFVQYRKHRHLYWKHLKLLTRNLILKQLLHKIHLEISHQPIMANPKIKDTILGYLPKVIYLLHYQRWVAKISKIIVCFNKNDFGVTYISIINMLTYI
jgi:hypothetical protein